VIGLLDMLDTALDSLDTVLDTGVRVSHPVGQVLLGALAQRQDLGISRSAPQTAPARPGWS
jgi:hypothetical protein